MESADFYWFAVSEWFAIFICAAIPKAQFRIMVLVQAGIVLGGLLVMHGRPVNQSPKGARCSTIHIARPSAVAVSDLT